MEAGKREGNILIVDDDRDVLATTSMLLEAFGYRTIPCPAAAEALDCLKNGGVDVVLSDISMPLVSGIELLEKVHGLDPEMPVILMTGYTDFDKAVDAVKMRAFDFILKPFKPEHLAHSVEKALIYTRLLKTEKDYRHLLEDFSREIEALVAERTVSLLALTLADKIRNPATVIGLTCKSILEGAEGSGDIRQHLKTIVGEAEKLDSTVQQFTSFLKYKKSMFVYQDVNAIVRGAVSVAQQEAADAGIEFTVACAEEPLMINADKHLMQVALIHVMRNAITATPQGGRVTVSTSQEPETVVVTVSDTGCGIAAEDIPRIFDPFFSTKRYSFGMGLPLVRQIVMEHLGQICVESLQGRGTTIRITLPCRWTEKDLDEMAGTAT